MKSKARYHRVLQRKESLSAPHYDNDSHTALQQRGRDESRNQPEEMQRNPFFFVKEPEEMHGIRSSSSEASEASSVRGRRSGAGLVTVCGPSRERSSSAKLVLILGGKHVRVG